MSGTVSSKYIRSVYETCVDEGADAAALLQVVPGGQAALTHPAGRFESDILFAVYHRAEALLGHVGIGLTVGQNFRPTTFRDIGYGLIACNSLRHAIAFNKSYQSLTQQIGSTDLTNEGGSAWLRWTPVLADPDQMRPATEAVFAGYLGMGRWLTWIHDQEIRSMRFRHERPIYGDMCDAFFGCPVHYGAPCDEMEFEETLVDLPLPQPNPELVKIISKRLDEAMAELSNPPTYSAMTYQAIEDALPDGPPSIPGVAEQIGMTERTLRRRLEAEGASFRDLLERARRDACEVYLREPGRTAAEIAQLLGYSEQSAFTRAFKGWYGVPPSQYRAPPAAP